MKKTIEYKLKGTRLKARAIGEPENFSVNVFRHVGTMTPLKAMDTARESMYQDGYENILFESCAVRVGRHWRNIPMIEALELE